jgi:hypothetical protein
MSPLVLGLALAVLASLALNGSYLVQHVGSVKAPAINIRHPLLTVRGLLGSRLWMLGGMLGVGGWLIHIAALTKAPLSLVQCFLAAGIALLTPIAVVRLGHQLRRGEFVGIALIVVALVALALSTGAEGAHSSFGAGALGAYVAGAVAVGIGLATVVGGRRAVALGLAGGVLYGLADVVTKALTGIAHDDGATGVLTSPWLIAAIAANVGAFFAFQRGLQSGTAIAVIALMTAGTNVISILGGLLVFGDPLGSTTAIKAVHIAAFVAIAIAGWLLAPAQAVASGGSGLVTADGPRA